MAYKRRYSSKIIIAIMVAGCVQTSPAYADEEIKKHEPQINDFPPPPGPYLSQQSNNKTQKNAVSNNAAVKKSFNKKSVNKKTGKKSADVVVQKQPFNMAPVWGRYPAPGFDSRQWTAPSPPQWVQNPRQHQPQYPGWVKPPAPPKWVQDQRQQKPQPPQGPARPEWAKPAQPPQFNRKPWTPPAPPKWVQDQRQQKPQLPQRPARPEWAKPGPPQFNGKPWVPPPPPKWVQDQRQQRSQPPQFNNQQWMPPAQPWRPYADNGLNSQYRR